MNFFNVFKSPDVFEKSPDNIWTNEKLSSFIFQSHFDENIYGGSRNSEFIDTSIDKIITLAKNYSCKNIIDLGCGPGIYTHPLAQFGYNVVGVDISKKSINFAKQKAFDENLNIKYINSDFFNLSKQENQDMVLLLYEIYSTFNSKQRKLLLDNIYKMLNNDGIFILDVPSINRLRNIKEMSNWTYFNKDTLYNSEPFFLFFKSKIYNNNILLNHSIFLFQNSSIVNCYDWVQHFNKSSIIKELKSTGFKILSTYSDISGNELLKNSMSIALVCKKV
ncbi:class I SAM-dependent methyltransferase [Staphylococcus hominis]|uniref:class I SAM-dependent methyltransferase n=1 Tax=Staphylococcus hominis TaxID=1290 RepID=UPI00287B116B|nr:class I SAM-dependent methyltransferase [Staphylococcus hominis]MDS3898911.1 class I SAM-dependent methyltransferase [Staphylococcus hominis]